MIVISQPRFLLWQLETAEPCPFCFVDLLFQAYVSEKTKVSNYVLIP